MLNGVNVNQQPYSGAAYPYPSLPGVTLNERRSILNSNYNALQTNGVYSCENAHILRDLLRDQLKFDGWVMSDWGATHSTVDSAKNGLDQQMPDDTSYGAASACASVDTPRSIPLPGVHQHHRRLS